MVLQGRLTCGFLVLLFLAAVRVAGLSVSWLEDMNIGAIPEEDRLTQRQLLRMITAEHQCKARQVWHIPGISPL